RRSGEENQIAVRAGRSGRSFDLGQAGGEMSVERAVIRQNVAPMRASPDTRAEQVSQAIFGETVRVLGRDREFAEIETPDTYRGWARASHLCPLASDSCYPDP